MRLCSFILTIVLVSISVTANATTYTETVRRGDTPDRVAHRMSDRIVRDHILPHLADTNPGYDERNIKVGTELHFELYTSSDVDALQKKMKALGAAADTARAQQLAAETNEGSARSKVEGLDRTLALLHQENTTLYLLIFPVGLLAFAIAYRLFEQRDKKRALAHRAEMTLLEGERRITQAAARTLVGLQYIEVPSTSGFLAALQTLMRFDVEKSRAIFSQHGFEPRVIDAILEITPPAREVRVERPRKPRTASRNGRA